jgi:hypothetical protein
MNSRDAWRPGTARSAALRNSQHSYVRALAPLAERCVQAQTRAGALLSGMTRGSARSGDEHDDGRMHDVDGVGNGLLGDGGSRARQVCSAAPVTVAAKAWGCR